MQRRRWLPAGAHSCSLLPTPLRALQAISSNVLLTSSNPRFYCTEPLCKAVLGSLRACGIRVATFNVETMTSCNKDKDEAGVEQTLSRYRDKLKFVAETILLSLAFIVALQVNLRACVVARLCRGTRAAAAEAAAVAYLPAPPSRLADGWGMRLTALPPLAGDLQRECSYRNP